MKAKPDVAVISLPQKLRSKLPNLRDLVDWPSHPCVYLNEHAGYQQELLIHPWENPESPLTGFVLRSPNSKHPEREAWAALSDALKRWSVDEITALFHQYDIYGTEHYNTFEWKTVRRRIVLDGLEDGEAQLLFHLCIADRRKSYAVILETEVDISLLQIALDARKARIRLVPSSELLRFQALEQIEISEHRRIEAMRGINALQLCLESEKPEKLIDIWRDIPNLKFGPGLRRILDARLKMNVAFDSNFWEWAFRGKSKELITWYIEQKPIYAPEIVAAAASLLSEEFSQARATAGIPNPAYFEFKRRKTIIEDELLWAREIISQ